MAAPKSFGPGADFSEPEDEDEEDGARGLRNRGFPVFRGIVFWEDFVEWRGGRIGLKPSEQGRAAESQTEEAQGVSKEELLRNLNPKAARILADRFRGGAVAGRRTG